MFKRIIILLFLLLLSSCNNYSSLDPGEIDICDYFECIREYYANVVLNDPENYPEYSHSVATNRWKEEYEIISYKGEYKLDEVTDGFDAKREYSINFFEYTSSVDSYSSLDTGFVKVGSSYERQDYSFYTNMSISIFVGERTKSGKRVFDFVHTPSSYYYNEKGEIVDNELTKKMSEKIGEIMTNCLKVIDKYCRDNNKGLYAGGHNKDLDLFAK